MWGVGLSGDLHAALDRPDPMMRPRSAHLVLADDGDRAVRLERRYPHVLDGADPMLAQGLQELVGGDVLTRQMVVQDLAAINKEYRAPAQELRRRAGGAADAVDHGVPEEQDGRRHQAADQ